jgi:pilus assembly protein Flp/PilA
MKLSNILFKQYISCNRRDNIILAQILLKFLDERRPTLMNRLFKLFKNDRGASAVEYGLLVALIAAVIVGAVTLLGGNLQATFNYIATIVLKP